MLIRSAGRAPICLFLKIPHHNVRIYLGYSLRLVCYYLSINIMQQLIHSAVYQLSHTLSPNKSFPELVETNAMHCYVAFTYVSGSTVFFFCMRSTHRCKYVNVTIIFFHRIKLPVKITLPYHPSAAGEMATLHASLAFHEHGME